MESHDVVPARGRTPGYGFLFRALLGSIGRRHERSLALSYLLDASELPGEGWHDSRQSSFRSVRLLVHRSSHLRCVSASRNYRVGRPTRYLGIEIVLMESPGDATRMVERSRTRYYRNVMARLVAEREMTAYTLPALADSQLYERETVQKSLHYVNRHLAGRVGDISLHVIAGGSGGGWEWAEVVDFATAQAEKIRRLRPEPEIQQG